MGYDFHNAFLLHQALTHSSTDTKGIARLAYERLEFLGDAVLELIITAELYALLPQADEGKLTQLRSRIVSRQTLAEVALTLGLGNRLFLGPSEEKSGGRTKGSILANTFESIIGAIHLDGGLLRAKEVILRVLQAQIEDCTQCQEEVNPKGELQNLLQSIAHEAPIYDTTEITPPPGQDHAFLSRVLWQGKELGTGSGSSKRRAEVDAASNALLLKIWS